MQDAKMNEICLLDPTSSPVSIPQIKSRLSAACGSVETLSITTVLDFAKFLDTGDSHEQLFPPHAPFLKWKLLTEKLYGK